MADQVQNDMGGHRWVEAVVCPLAMRATQAQAAVRDVNAGRASGGPFSGDEGGCPLSADELRILRRELGAMGGVL